MKMTFPIVNREERNDVTKIQICEVMGFYVIFRKNTKKKASFSKISLLVQISGEI